MRYAVDHFKCYLRIKEKRNSVEVTLKCSVQNMEQMPFLLGKGVAFNNLQNKGIFVNCDI